MSKRERVLHVVLWLVGVVGLAALASASMARAQSLPLLTRTTSTTGLNDSALTLISDSAQRTRAATVLQYRKALSVHAFDSVLTTKLNLTGATITGSPTWSGTFTAAAGQLVDSATGAARSQKLTTARTIFGQSFDGTANASGAITATTGNFSGAIVVASCTGCGGGGATVSDTVKLVTFDSVRSVRARHDTISATAGASKPLTFQTWTSGSARKNTLVLGADTSTTHLGSVYAPAGVAGSTGSGFLFGVVGTVRGGLSCTSSNTCTFRAASADMLVLNQGSGTATLDGAAGESILVGSSAATGISFTTSAAVSAEITGGASPNLQFGGGGAGANAPTIEMAGGSAAGGGGFLRWTRGGSVKGYMGQDAGIRGGNSDTLTWYGEAAAPLLLFAKARRVAVLVDSQFMAVSGRTGKPTYSFNNGTTSGVYLGDNGSTDTLGFVASGSVFARGFSDTLIATSKMKALGLTAEPSTQSDLCIDATTFQVYINAAASCTVSAARFKKNIGAVSPAMARNIIRRVPVDSFTYKNGGRRAFGTIADTLALVDERLVTRNADGQVNAANYEQLTVLLISVVRDQQALIDSLQRQIDAVNASIKKPSTGKPQ